VTNNTGQRNIGCFDKCIGQTVANILSALGAVIYLAASLLNPTYFLPSQKQFGYVLANESVFTYYEYSRDCNLIVISRKILLLRKSILITNV